MAKRLSFFFANNRYLIKSQLHSKIRRCLKIFQYEGNFDSTYDAVDLEVRKICVMLGNPEYRFTPGFLFFLDYTLRELFNNAVEHGNRFQCQQKVGVWIRYDNWVMEIRVRDAGEGFDIPPITVMMSSNEQLPLRHRGLASVQKLGFHLESDQGLVDAQVNLAETDYLKESEER